MALTLPWHNSRSTETTIANARAIMGSHFYSVAQALKHFDTVITDEYRDALAVVPFGTETLTKYQDTHVLVPRLPLTIMDIRRCAPTLFLKDPADRPWYPGEPFATTRMPTGWLLIRHGAVPKTTGKTRPQQTKQLPRNEELPTACQLVFAIALEYLCTQELPYSNLNLCVSDTDTRGRPLQVAIRHGMRSQDPGNLHIYCDDHGFASGNTGLAGAIRWDTPPT